MIDLLKFKKNAIDRDLCKDYTYLWNNCHTVEDFAKMGLGVKGLDYLADAHVKGWGLDNKVLKTKFKDYINGYIHQNYKYTSALYVEYKKQIEAEATVTLLIDCNTYIHIPKNSIRQIFVSGKSHIRVSCDGGAIIVLYGKENSIETSGNGSIKIIKKEHRDLEEGQKLID